jgi:hypothetical protein
MGPLDLQAQQDHKDPQDHKDHKDPQVVLDHRAKLVLLDSQAQQDHKDPQDHKDHKDPQDPQVRQVFKVLMEPLDLKGPPDHRALKVPLD